MLGGRRVGRQVAFVDGNDHGAGGEGGDGGGVFGVRVGGGVEDEEDDIGFGHGFAGFGDAEGLGLVGGVAKAGGVDEFDGDAIEGDALCDEVAGGAWGGSDDGAVALD